MATLYSLKLQGQTAAGAAIATVAVSIDSDGYMRFTDGNGVTRAIHIRDNTAALLKATLGGATGIPTTQPLFGLAVLSGPGVGGRTDN